MDAIQIENVSKVYRIGEVETHALNGISLNIGEGEFTALVGPSGSGKTALLQWIGCLDKPDQGAVKIKGKDVTRLNANQRADLRREEIGFIFQFFALVPVLNAYENVELPLLYNSGASKASERRRRAMESLKLVGLEQRSHHLPNQLSGGQQQRVAIARALINNPSILLADEPTGNLDTKTSIEVMDVFQKLNQERGITVLLITHEQDIAEYGARIVSFRDGKIKSDLPVIKRRIAADEAAALPPVAV